MVHVSVAGFISIYNILFYNDALECLQVQGPQKTLIHKHRSFTFISSTV